jgi:hypothetical protein
VSPWDDQRREDPFITEGAKGIYRASDRSAPYNLMSNLTDISKTMKKISGRPDDYLPFGNPSKNPKGRPAKTISANFGNHTTNWIFQGGKYENQNSFAADGDHFPADQVLVLRVQIGDAGYTDPAGYPVARDEVRRHRRCAAVHQGSGRARHLGQEGPQVTPHPQSQGVVTWSYLPVAPGSSWCRLFEGNVAFHQVARPHKSEELRPSARLRPTPSPPPAAVPSLRGCGSPPSTSAPGRDAQDGVMVEVLPGMLLVATPGLLDPNFSDSVVLILDVDPEGTVGRGHQPTFRRGGG